MPAGVSRKAVTSTEKELWSCQVHKEMFTPSLLCTYLRHTPPKADRAEKKEEREGSQRADPFPFPTVCNEGKR